VKWMEPQIAMVGVYRLDIMRLICLCFKIAVG